MISALVVGLWTAWYLGLRAGVIAAIATAAALLAAQLIPGTSITIYVLVIAWCAALYFVIPKLGGANKASLKSSASIAAQANSAWSWAKKMLQR